MPSFLFSATQSVLLAHPSTAGPVTMSGISAVARQCHIHRVLFTKVSIWHQRDLMGDWAVKILYCIWWAVVPCLPAAQQTRTKSESVLSDCLLTVSSEVLARLSVRSHRSVSLHKTNVIESVPTGTNVWGTGHNPPRTISDWPSLWRATHWPLKVKMLIGHPNGPRYHLWSDTDTVASPAVKQNLLMGHAEWKMLLEVHIKPDKSSRRELYGCQFYTATGWIYLRLHFQCDLRPMLPHYSYV